MAAVVALIVGAVVLLVQNWDKIAVKEPERPAVSTSSTSPDSVFDYSAPEFETKTDRLKLLYPEMFGLSPEPFGLTLGYTTNTSGECFFTIFVLNDPWRSDVLSPDMSKMNYISADEMKCVLNTYDDEDIHFVVYWNSETSSIVYADTTEVRRICDMLGIEINHEKIPPDTFTYDRPSGSWFELEETLYRIDNTAPFDCVTFNDDGTCSSIFIDEWKEEYDAIGYTSELENITDENYVFNVCS